MSKLDLKRKVFDTPGYSADVSLTADELAVFREEITRQWLDVIGRACPDHLALFEAAGIERYHELAHLIDHGSLWQKHHRVLPIEACARIRNMPFLRLIHEEFGDFQIAEVFYGNTHEIGREEVYWRLVRPREAADVGPLHADKWFHQINQMHGRAFPKGALTVKIWIPIWCEAGRNGLMIVADSHRQTWRFHAVDRGYGDLKPQIDEDVARLDAQLVPTDPGNMIIFNEGTLHGGAFNQGDHSRVSVEITLVFT
ncbi:hypothetical protein GWL_06280 [Herbaspirillum sp. GW103]|jgi:hypothetical protein|uniref:phytanoyl-CoA dioxygenase family protein n=1 Tax=Herbaspirillum sp. GW103 TaxID=1175306 RepID=UPI00025E2A8B|nr:phytanoyl-CoA dioxygenase family protein [Herbaspirillum sp. GW103]EIJ48594.1 hypothetical protein GWL_06280 [Herbaspirillum sp. GW103]